MHLTVVAHLFQEELYLTIPSFQMDNMKTEGLPSDTTPSTPPHEAGAGDPVGFGPSGPPHDGPPKDEPPKDEPPKDGPSEEEGVGAVGYEDE